MSPEPGSDPVLELLAGEGADARGLYYLWERQQWEAGKIDLAEDALQWAELDPASRRPVADSVAWRRLRAEVATDALVPFVDAGPTEEQQVFLSTQLVDEARHLVFFDRVRAEVIGDEGVLMEDRGGIVDDPSLQRLLSELLPAAAAGLSAPGADVAALVRAEVVYGIAVVGALGLTEQKALVMHLEVENLLPGLRRGLELEASAAARHVAFALGFLSGAVADHPDAQAGMLAALESALPPVRSALSALGDASPTPYGEEELVARADAALKRWFEAAELAVPVPG